MVEEIIGKRTNKRSKSLIYIVQSEYLVKWVGYPVEQSTWEPMRNLRYVVSMVEEFEKNTNNEIQNI
jgi:hypothetical protein